MNKQAIHKRNKNKCVVCGSSERLTVDHKWPLCLGGCNCNANLTTMCGPCNILKGFLIWQDTTLCTKKDHVERRKFTKQMLVKVGGKWVFRQVKVGFFKPEKALAKRDAA